jgi:hypothetical protein
MAAPSAALPPTFLSEPAAGDAADIALGYVRRHHADLGLATGDLVGMVVRDRYTTRHNGVAHVYLQQRQDGLEVVNALLNVNVDREGRVVSLGNRFVADLGAATKTRTPAITAGEAVQQSLALFDLPRQAAVLELSSLGGPAQEVVFRGDVISREDIPVKLAYFPKKSDEVRLAWGMVIHLHNNRHWYNLWIDAEDGTLLGAHDWVGRLAPAPQPGASALPAALASYRVFALPAMNPDDAGRALVSVAPDPQASPFGWHDVDGRPGADSTTTRGNNVRAVAGESGQSPNGGNGLVFDLPLDLTQPPASYTDAAVVNLFYWVNTLHDLHYRYGFDEPAGNFQMNQYGRGGLGGDAVQAFAQVAPMVTFAAPPDGMSPQMQLFVATPITALIAMEHTLSVVAPAKIAGTYPAAGAYFGALLDVRGVEGRLVAAEDGAAGEVEHPGGPPVLRQGTGSRADACEPLANREAVEGAVALVDDGSCSVVTKARNVAAAGAAAMVLVGRADGQLRTLGGHGEGDDVRIPVVAVDASTGSSLRRHLRRGVSVALKSDSALVHRDSDLDSGVLIHEYGHGVASRLTGGPSSAGCLQAAQSMGLVEGVGDLWALALTAKLTDGAGLPRAISTYVFFQPPDGTGVRGIPYSTDPAVNDVSYGDMPSFGEHGMMIPHAVGTLWASILWEVYWSLVKAEGFDPDLFAGEGGNNLMLQLVMDGLKLQPCNPSLMEARDAILLADQLATGGRHQCSLWQGFAKRGMGVDAVDSSDPDDLKVTAGTAVPAECGGAAALAAGAP